MKTREFIAWALIVITIILAMYKIKLSKVENKNLKADIKERDMRVDSLQALLAYKELRIDSFDVAANKQEEERNAVILPSKPQYNAPSKVDRSITPDSTSRVLGDILH